jgi:hypothetical protein
LYADRGGIAADIVERPYDDRMIPRIIFVVVASALIAGCGDSATISHTPTAPSAATNPAATATSGGEDAPTPQHLKFAPGETIAADRRAGIFFLDPKSDAAEAWVVPAATFPELDALPFSFTVGGFSSDGGKVVYTCLEPKENSVPVPCGGGAATVWYLLDTTTGERTRVETFSGSFLSISPNGKTLFGATADGLGLADVLHSGAPRPVHLPPGTDISYPHLNWSPGGARIVLTIGFEPSTFLLNTATGSINALDSAAYGGGWSPDGARLSSWKQISEGEGELRVLDRDGRLVWSKRAKSGGAAGTWSADGALLYTEVQDQPRAGDGFGALDRVDILDSSTGATAYRIKGGFCPLGWVGETHRLLTESYGFGEALVDLDAHDLKLFDAYAMPMPFDGNTAIVFDGEDFSSYDLTTGATKLIAHTTVTPAWDTNHGALFAGNRLVFTALHGGHGGCGEGASPENPPQPELLAGPFADDVPVTRGKGR